ncbi:MAG: alpha-L-fucosidase [Draconibacterium sp.]|nr:alpha-L-fucosidase [Draconibacterium sp.]
MKIILSLFFTAFFLISLAQKEVPETSRSINNSQAVFETDQQLLKKFQDMKFGMFVHWGPVSLKGTEIGWSRGNQVSIEEYDNLYKQFNPTKFNADEWIKTLKDAGMKYIVFTTRHHDGFSMWPTEYSDYSIAATPYKKDILMELKKACDKYGIMFGTYYSICDWKNLDYPLGSPGGRTKKETGNMEKFIPFIKGQTKELIEKYNTKILWFDGEWEAPWTHEMGLDFYQYLKGLNQHILINNRVDKGRKGMEGITISKEFAGDYATPEQRVGTYNVDAPWESCITICKQWAWKPNDKMKSLEECLFTLLKTVGGGGNLLLNVGPMPDGRIEPRQVERLKEMGNWLKKYGEAIYRTVGGPYKPNEWLASTRKENNIYLFLMDFKKSEVRIPFPSDVKIENCKILGGEKLVFKQTGELLQFELPAKQNELVTTIEINIDGSAEDIETINLN